MTEIQPKDRPNEGLTENWVRMGAALRKYLRDFAPLNRLVSGEESTDNDLYLAILNCIEDINGTPPFTSFTLDQLLTYHQGYTLLIGAACNAVEGLVLHYARNEVKFTDSGISVAVSDKSPAFMRWYQVMRSTYEQKKRAFLTAWNSDQIMGTDEIGVHSEYFNLIDFVTDSA